ncbi:MAG: bacillithiol system redox-active protein YtxJ [Bacteroidota bacterium]
MQWKYITDLAQIDEIQNQPGYSLIFKHSTRCSVSMMAKRRFEMDWESIPADTSLYFLDLIAYRPISAQIAETFQVHHESPQILLLKDGSCVLDASHSDISAEEVAEVIASQPA